MTVHSIIFTDEGALIEYTDVTQGGPFSVSSQISVPFRVAQLHPQVHHDLMELMQDAETLLDSVNLARVSEAQRPVQEMGRE